jgi:hypothetical protein
MSKIPFYKPFADLAGSIYLTLPANLQTQQIYELVSHNKAIIFDQPNKVKVIFDNYITDEVENIFGLVDDNLIFTPYNSHFFILSRSEIKKTLAKSAILDWQYYSKDFFIDIYNPRDKAILVNILDNSFAVVFGKSDKGLTTVSNHEIKQRYILDNFDKHIANLDLKTFIIRSKIGQIVGTFGLTVVGAEVQLSAVAGRFVDSGDIKSYTGDKKLPIISAAFVEIFASQIDFAKYDKLTFSNSKPTVIKFYSELGFEDNLVRNGFLFQVQK